LPKAYRAIA